MRPDIFYKKNNGGMIVSSKLNASWVIKAPTVKNRLHKGGSAGLKMAEKYDLQHNKLGILFIDHSARAYVFLPKQILMQPTPKNCNGLNNSIFSFDVNLLVNTHNLELIQIPVEGETPESYELGLAGEIRKKFGL
jgi:hypothetical protein